MQVFMADKSTASLSADFIEPFSAWENLPPLDPIIMESIAWIADLNNHADAVPVCEYDTSTAQTVSTLINRAKSLIVGLLETSESVSMSFEEICFNGLIGVRTQASAAMARCLYRTVALHLTDMAVSFLSSSLGGAEGNALEQALEGFFNWKALCDDLHVAVFGGPDEPGEPSMALRALTMVWPMMAISQSKIASRDVKLMARESLGHGAKFMHIARS